MTCATQGPRGWPHLMPLWYVVRDGRLWAWTFAKSQKVRNLERDPRATLQVEAGRDQYHLLRGVMLESDVVAAPRHRGRHRSSGWRSSTRYSGAGGELSDEVREMVAKPRPPSGSAWSSSSAAAPPGTTASWGTSTDADR